MIEHSAGDALQPGRAGRVEVQQETAALHWRDDTCSDQAGEMITTDSTGSSLATGEDVVLRGCELGHNAQGVDPHARSLLGTADSEVAAGTWCGSATMTSRRSTTSCHQRGIDLPAGGQRSRNG
jgi:hypothetical protein